mmetsp:Transcript_6994/g.12455  ORF Transcript_6994/g.12455 Transcript_6994/m.12455 type:complete len:482 (+) Transcript_6994:442-1887(+)
MLFRGWLAVCALGVASHALNATSSGNPACLRVLDEARLDFPIEEVGGDVDYAEYSKNIIEFNQAATIIEGTVVIAVTALVWTVVTTGAPIIAGVAFAMISLFAMLFKKDEATDYYVILEKIQHLVEAEHVNQHLERCSAQFRHFHVFLEDTYDCTVSNFKVAQLKTVINELMAECDVIGAWGMEPGATFAEAGCVASTSGLCYEVMPVTNAAALASLNLLNSVYSTTTNQDMKDGMALFRERVIRYINLVHHPETVRLWTNKMNDRTEVVCSTRYNHIKDGSFYSWNWGRDKAWLSGKAGPCKFDEYRKSSERFNLAKVEHLLRSTFTTNALSSTPNQGCTGLLWGEICLLENSNTWKKSTCEQIRHNYFCEYTPGCKMDSDKCVSIQPESIENCWLQGLPRASNNKAACSLLSSKTATGCSWRNGWGCRPGLGKGAIVGTQSCAKDYKPCLKDWGSNGTEWSVCANSTECVNVYHGKVIV